MNDGLDGPSRRPRGNDGLDGPSRTSRGNDGLDAPPRRVERNDSLDAPPRRSRGGGGMDAPARIPRGTRGGGMDDCMDKRRGNDDLDGMDSSLKGEPSLRRTGSNELENSFSLGGVEDSKSWKHLDTVHKKTTGYDAFGDSDSLMEDSFAGSSFASNCDSIGEGSEDKAKAAFQTLDDDPRQKEQRRRTPGRTYSKQKPKPLDTMVAISEAEDADEGEEEGLD